MTIKQTIPSLLAALAFCVSSADANSEQLISRADELTRESLVLVECKYADDSGETTLTGLGVCYDAEKGDFLTFALGPKIRRDLIRDLKVVPTGFQQEPIPAELIGTRPAVGMAFVRAKGKRAWRAVRFARSCHVKTGQVVASAGLMPGARANNRYFGLGHVSSLLRVPERIHYVTGGRLTCTGSPVFAQGSDAAIGIVYKTIYMDYQMPTSRGASMVSLKGRQESAFFMPVEEFAFVFDNVPQSGQVFRPGSLGFLKALGVSKSQSELLGIDVPAVTIDQVIPTMPAYEAGLRNGDAIVAIDGKAIEVLSSSEFTGANLIRRIMLMSPGQPVKVTVRRRGSDSELPMKVAEMPLLPEEAPVYTNQKLGFAMRQKVKLDMYLDQSGTGKVPGMLVTAVASDSPADDAGLKSSDVVTAVNGETVRSVQVCRKVIAESLAADQPKPIMLMVHRSGSEPRVVTIKP